jgi:hypothetical protein
MLGLLCGFSMGRKRKSQRAVREKAGHEGKRRGKKGSELVERTKVAGAATDRLRGSAGGGRKQRYAPVVRGQGGDWEGEGEDLINPMTDGSRRQPARSPISQPRQTQDSPQPSSPPDMDLEDLEVEQLGDDKGNDESAVTSL